MKRKPKGYRVRFVHDQDASFEECNGESEPLDEQEYAVNQYRACPDHMRAGSKVIDASTSPPTVGCAECGRLDYVDIPYDEYLRYYGNPDRHVYLGCIAETQCACCGHWDQASSVWGIDFMDDSPEYAAIDLDTPIPALDALRLPGYAGDVAREELENAGMRIPKGAGR